MVRAVKSDRVPELGPRGPVPGPAPRVFRGPERPGGAVLLPILVLGAFCAVTVTLILHHPGEEPGEDYPGAGGIYPVSSTVSRAEVSFPGLSGLPVLTAAPAPPVAPSVAPNMAPPRPVLRPTARPAAAPADTLLFGHLLEDNPALLTVTARAPDGALRPWLPQYLQASDAAAIEDDPARRERDDALRARLAAAPTRAIHTVRDGDSLASLAGLYYGDEAKADILLEANRRRLGADGSMLIGQLLRIPDLDNL